MPVPFPVISDLDMKISRKYGMLAPNVSNTQTIRSVFFIDPNQKIRCILQYPMTTGRNVGEIIRVLEAMQTSDREGCVTPANWVPGQPTIMPSPNTYNELLERLKSPMGYNCMDWYLCFNPSDEPMPISGMTNQYMPYQQFQNSNCNCNCNSNCNCNHQNNCHTNQCMPNKPCPREDEE